LNFALMFRYCIFGLPLILCLMWEIPLAAQTDGNWTSFTDMNSSSEFIYDGSLIWGAAPGGAFAFYRDGTLAKKLTNIEGLRGLELNTVEADSAGNLWFGAVNGTLSKFDSDGNYLTYYFIFKRRNVIDEPLIIYDLSADNEWLWIARQEGISKFSIYNNGGEIKENIEHMGSLVRPDVKVVFIDDNRIWFGTKNGIGYADKNSPFLPDGAIWTVFDSGNPAGLGNLDIRSIAYFDGHVYAGTAYGVYFYNESSYPGTWNLSGLPEQEINSLRLSADTLFAATNLGPYYTAGGTWQPYNMAGYPGGEVDDIAHVPEAGLFAAFSDGGFARYNGLWESFYLPGPRGQDYGDIVATENEVWGISYGVADQPGLAINHFDGTTWENYTDANSGLISDVFYSTAIDSSGRAWFGYWGNGISVYDQTDSTWFNYNHDNSPLYGVGGGYVVISAIGVDADRNIWMGSFKANLPHGIFILKSDSTWQEIQLSENGLQSNWFSRIILKGHQALFPTLEGFDMLDYGTDLVNTADDVWHHFDKSSDLISNASFDADFDNNGYIWICSDGGLNYYDPQFDYLDSLPLPFGFGPAVRNIEIDGLGNKWLATPNGLLRLSPDNTSWTSYTTTNSQLVNNDILSLFLVKSAGILWIGTMGGISRFDTGLESPSLELTEIRTYPNPAGPKFAQKVYFSRVPFGAKIRIFNIAGEKIQEIDATNDNGLTSWDFQNSSGETCAGGVYIYHIITASKDYSTTGKFVLIR